MKSSCYKIKCYVFILISILMLSLGSCKDGGDEELVSNKTVPIQENIDEPIMIQKLNGTDCIDIVDEIKVIDSSDVFLISEYTNLPDKLRNEVLINQTLFYVEATGFVDPDYYQGVCIYGWNINNGEKTIIYEKIEDKPIQITCIYGNDKYLLWNTYDEGAKKELYLYDRINKTTKLIYNTERVIPNPTLEGDYIVWYDIIDDIYQMVIYNTKDDSVRYFNDNNGISPDGPVTNIDICNGQIVYYTKVGDLYEIKLYDYLNDHMVNIITVDKPIKSLQYDKNYIVWKDREMFGSIYVYNLEEKKTYIVNKEEKDISIFNYILLGKYLFLNYNGYKYNNRDINIYAIDLESLEMYKVTDFEEEIKSSSYARGYNNKFNIVFRDYENRSTLIEIVAVE